MYSLNKHTFFVMLDELFHPLVPVFVLSTLKVYLCKPAEGYPAMHAKGVSRDMHGHAQDI